MEMRLLTYSEIELAREVIETRSSMMLSGQNVHPNFFPYHFQNQSNFEKNLCFGFFDDARTLDCFIHLDLWEELPVYSQTIYTRARSGRLKTEDHLDINMCTLLNFQLAHMENVGMYTVYSVTNSTTWRPFYASPTNNFSRYEVEVVEYIPTGQLSRYVMFRNHLVSRPFDLPLNVKKHVLPLNLR